jgi:cation:H+ antiporter
MILSIVAVIVGLVLLAWSADRFVEGAAVTARHAGAPPLLIGMVIVGFGTSAPEMAVSALAALENNPGLALGNAYGSNIANIGLVLGLAALIQPIGVHSQVLRKELPILCGVTLLAAGQLWDGQISRLDAWILLGVFGSLMGWTVWQGLRQHGDALEVETQQELDVHAMPLRRAVLWLVVGLVLLVGSSRLLVWGAVEIALAFGISDLVIGLTVVAVGTSLPELAAAIMAARKGEHDLVIGNVLGSNLFNTLAVVGIAGAIQPMSIAGEVLSRDWLVMGVLTFMLFAIGYGFRGRAGRVNRYEAVGLLVAYAGYTGWIVAGVLGARP